jgi:hypothetical protein
VKFHRFSFSADRAIERYNKHVLNETDSLSIFYFNKIMLCGCNVLLITPDTPKTNRHYFSKDILDKTYTLFEAWRSVIDSPVDMHKQKNAWQTIDRIGKPLQINEKYKSSPILRHFNNDTGHNNYFILLNGKEPEGIPIADIFPLCNIWQLANNHFPLHAAGIIHKKRLFVFLGKSGTGKSTITELGKEIGDTTLDEDQLLISDLFEKGYKADAWGYNLNQCDLPICAFFNLIQDAEDRIIPLKPMNLARLLFERHNDIMANQSPEDLIKRAFSFFAEVARQTPGFELHFRKSPDFWKLIDEQFPQ